MKFDDIKSLLGDKVVRVRITYPDGNKYIKRLFIARDGFVCECMKKFAELSQTPVVLTSPVIRTYLSRMLSQFYPNLYVLAFNEITSNVQIQAIGNITLKNP